MLFNEAVWIGRFLKDLSPTQISPIANIGSSTGDFRKNQQPHIDAEIYAPLSASGVDVVHIDIKAADGVDVVADVTTPDGQAKIAALNAKCMLCFNLLEHLENPTGFCAALERATPSNGLLLVSVPHSYPYHRDPIDTMFRPTPAEIAALFPNCGIETQAVVACGSYRDKVAKKPKLVLNHLLWALTPFLGLTRWKRNNAKLLWLFRPYLVSIVALRRS
ncbi:MAG: hypothetical protein AAF360_16710 [Pseudomonadota bacterium]